MNTMALGFNRTFMELKWSKLSRFCRRTESFNRTFMELKYEAWAGKMLSLVSFNRTFMELKCTVKELFNHIPGMF